MALRPCSAHRGRFPGPAQSVYPAVVVGLDGQRTKLKLCQRCFAAYSDTVLAKLTEVQEDDDGLEFAHKCYLCPDIAPVEQALFPIFVTWYPNGVGRRDAYAQICAAHMASDGHNLLEPRYAAPGVASGGK